MTEVRELRPPQPDVSDPADLATTSGFALHQEHVTAWLNGTRGVITRPTFERMIAFSDLYGVPIWKDQEDDLLQEMTDTEFFDHPSQVKGIVRNAYIGLVTLSPHLSTFQKGDLLSRVAQTYDTDTVPANGNKIVGRKVRSFDKRLKRGLKHQTGSNRDAFESRQRHVSELATMIKDWLPPLTRREYYRRAASAVSGEPVTNVVKAFGILVAHLEGPSEKQQRRQEERYAARLPQLVSAAERRRDRAIQRAAEASAEYNALRSQQALTTDDILKDRN